MQVFIILNLQTSFTARSYDPRTHSYKELSYETTSSLQSSKSVGIYGNKRCLRPVAVFNILAEQRHVLARLRQELIIHNCV